MSEKLTVDLDGVPETLLWPLYCRAVEAGRSDGVLRDPKAAALLDSLDYPFEQNFGNANHALALRALCFDAQVRRFLADHPDGTVVALGEGLETQFWRVDNARMRWLTVDLPESMQVREKLLGSDERRRGLACSALDYRWMDEVDASNGVFITAQGLLMYFSEEEALGLISACAERFPGSWMMFDAVPPWLTRKTSDGTWLSRLMMRGRKSDDGDTSGTYRLPPMRWGATVDDLRQLPGLHPNIEEVTDHLYPRGRGLVLGFFNPYLGSTRIARNRRPSNTLVRFGSSAGASS